MKERTLLIILTSSIGLLCGLYGLYSNKKLKDTMAKFDMTIDNLSNNIDISEKIIEEAVTKAANKSVDKYMKNAVNEAIHEVERSINRAAKESVDKEFENYKPLVKDSVENKIKQIDICSIKEQIISNTSKQMSKKFESDVDDLVNEYKKNLSNIDKICKNLSGLKDTGSGITITL